MDGRARVLSLIDAAWTTQAIATACELGIPQRLATARCDGEALARAVDADVDATCRLLRALATLGLCDEDPEGRFALSEDGAWLLPDRDDSLGAWARLSGTRLWSNWGQLAESVRSGRCARERLRGHEDWGDLDADSQAAAVFNAAMIDLTRPVGRAAARVLDWRGISTAVDVGGGAGALVAEILGVHRGMRGVVFDLAHAEPAARQLAAAAGLAERCRFVAGSFFEPVPAGADAYLLKSVLHNWGDAQAAAILRSCAAGMRPGATLILFERLRAEPGGARDLAREVARSDLNMLVGCGGRERRLGEFAALLGDAGLKVRDVVPMAGGLHAIVATGV